MSTFKNRRLLCDSGLVILDVLDYPPVRGWIIPQLDLTDSLLREIWDGVRRLAADPSPESVESSAKLALDDSGPGTTR